VELELQQKLDDRAFVLALGTRILCDDGSSNIHIDPTDEQLAAAEEGTNVDDETANEDTVEAGAPRGKRPALRSVLARYMIHITTCRDCGGAWQDGGGVRVQVNRSVLERAQCNAVICDDENGKRPIRTIPLPTQRLVLERAQHRCEVPGCRSSKHLTIHHIVFWSHGGTHDPSNLVVLCDGHHRVLHDGFLKISGRAPDQLVFERNGNELVGKPDGHALRKHAEGVPRHSNGRAVKKAMAAPNLNEDSPVVLARAALRQMGFKAAVAAGAVETACAHVGIDLELSLLIKESLRYCR
jgi:hypothetical protein